MKSNIRGEKENRINWLTTISIAAAVICAVQVIHEGMHALTCLLVGGDLLEFSALHVDCLCQKGMQGKIVAGNSSLVNLAVGTIVFLIIRRPAELRAETRYFLWLFMLLNWLVGAGYWLFSGVANVGDWAVVIEGMNNPGLLRIIMAGAGGGLYMYFVWAALRLWGRYVGGSDLKEQVSRSSTMTVLSYFSILIVIAIAGISNPYGISGLPAVAALMLALGGMSPLLWMMQWFSAKSFKKIDQPALVVAFRPGWMVSGAAAAVLYAVVLGRGFRFG